MKVSQVSKSAFAPIPNFIVANFVLPMVRSYSLLKKHLPTGTMQATNWSFPVMDFRFYKDIESALRATLISFVYFAIFSGGMLSSPFSVSI